MSTIPERPRRHKWVPLSEAPTRDDLRRCARPGCGMLRSDYGSQRYEFRTAEFKWIANQKRTWPMPPCEGKR